MAYGFDKPKMKPCLGGMKHKWTFMGNVQNQRISISGTHSSVQMSLKGSYKCHLCGARKQGPYNPNEPGDLRDAVGVTNGHAT